eukprot:3884733-Rhodomonas_salina.2
MSGCNLNLMAATSCLVTTRASSKLELGVQEMSLNTLIPCKIADSDWWFSQRFVETLLFTTAESLEAPCQSVDARADPGAVPGGNLGA